MLAPVDVWTIAHGFVGFLSGRIKIRRLLIYPIPILWEIYQLYFHYQPQGEGLNFVWLNSVFDISTFLVLYEVANWHNLKHYQMEPCRRLTDDAKGIMAYILITLGIAWLFWDDIFRLKLAARMPSPQVPLLFGALSPAIASFIVRTWVSRRRPARSASSWITREQRFYYSVFGVLPSAIIYIIMLCVTTFGHVVPW